MHRVALFALLSGCCLGGSALTPLTLGPGFSPQPTIQNGTVRDNVIDGAFYDPMCLGYFPSSPQHVVNVTAPINYLRIVVNTHGAGDARLVVQLPDGSFRCSDFMERTNVAVESYVSAGTLAVFVGAASSGADLPYTIGFTEQPGFPASALP